MSTDDIVETRRNRTIPESLRGPLFVAGVVLGMILFAIGFGFLVLGISVDTIPPAPYVHTMVDKFLVIGFGLGAMTGGALVVRTAARAVGW